MQIDFYFDFLSPYSYLAWCTLRQIKFEQKATFNYYPVVLSQVIGHYQTKGPSEIEPKREYLFKDCLRKAHQFAIPFTVPAKLPFNSLYALRLCLGSIAKEKQFSFIDAFFRAAWEEGKDLGETTVVEEILLRLGQDKSFLDYATSSEARKELKANVQKALGAGAFGVPTFVINGELFWGQDSIPYLEAYLEDKDVVDPQVFSHFREIFGRA